MADRQAVKADVGLSLVDNTNDASKPVSTAQAAAIALKADIPSGWTAYTPSVAASAGAIGSFTSSGRYKVVGKIVFFNATVVVTDAGTGTGALLIGLPVAAHASNRSTVTGIESASSGKMLIGTIFSASSALAAGVRMYDFSTVIVNGYSSTINDEYEAA